MDTLPSAGVGAAITVPLVFVPFSPAVGGTVAAYLHDGDRAGWQVGALSGALASVPGITIPAAVIGIDWPISLPVLAAVAVVYFAVCGYFGGIVGEGLRDVD
ncbi:hypothetical protein GCM10027435_07590 [Haloparvum alkalitolerans]|uniref:DUF5518 domain-containing protein n=1 Tax=Haloparvum alkalitolerans TaxID=1042953 RepID=UPI003CF409C2